MRKKDKLYTANKHNTALFMHPADVDRRNQNIFDGWDSSKFGDPNSKNALGISKKDNPFSKGNMQSGGIGWSIIGGAGSTGMGAIDSLATQTKYGKKQTVGGSVLNSVGDAAISTGNPYAIIGGIAAKGIGTILNLGFGNTYNEEGISDIESGNASMRNQSNQLAQAASTDDFIDRWNNIGLGYDFDKDYIGDEGWWSNGVTKKFKDLQNKRNAARSYVAHAAATGAQAVNKNQNNMIRSSFIAALGGELQKNNRMALGGSMDLEMPINNNMSAIQYDLMTDFLATKKKNADNRNQMTNMFMGMPSSMFDFGGTLQSNGGDYGTGLVHIDAGLSHEMNPNDGVQMGIDSEGTPNLVEEGEVVFNDYVFSNRINIDDHTKALLHFPKKKDITYAEAAKKLENEIKERPNDPISEAGFKAQMQKLEEQQERQKADMEAARAREAFEALSPEEQTAVMQQAAQQEAMAQQAAQEQALAQQQVSPEEATMAQQQMMQADGSQAMIGQEPQMAACGGKLYDKGGDLKKLIYKLTGSNTESDYKAWLKKNGLGDLKDTEDWEHILENEAIMTAISKNDPALVDAIKKGYDFGAYKPENNGKATIQSISKGNWKTTNGKGWRGSEDLAFKQATEGLSDAEIDALTTEQLAERMRNTEAYKNTNKWLQNSDNALMYLNTLLNDPDTPQVAKDYAAKFVKDGKWKDGFNYDYATVFGSNGKGVRETNPGTYWHTAMEANRGNQMGNLVINDDGSIEEIVGDVPADWASAGSYAWATPENDLTYNYYRRPATPEAEVVPAPTTPDTPDKQKQVAANLKPEWMRYAGLFGPAVGLGLQMAGVGKPDYSDLDAAVENAGNVATASYQPLGDYLTYRPMDIWYEQNRLNANARATDRAILNSGANQGSKAAALLASGYNDQIASGDLYRKALEYNDALRQQVAGFNRGTNQFNAEQFGQTSRFNAAARNQANQTATSAKLNAAAQKLDTDAGWYNSLYGNVAGLFKGIGDLGRENAQHNMIARMGANGLYGTATPDTPVFQDFLKWQEEQKKNKKKSKGGKNHKKHDIIL